MNNTKFEMSNIRFDLEVLSENIDDWLDVNHWLRDEYFETRPKTAEEKACFVASFNEMRVKMSQQSMLIEHFNMEAKKLIERIEDVEKSIKKEPTSSNFAE